MSFRYFITYYVMKISSKHWNVLNINKEKSQFYLIRISISDRESRKILESNRSMDIPFQYHAIFTKCILNHCTINLFTTRPCMRTNVGYYVSPPLYVSFRWTVSLSICLLFLSVPFEQTRLLFLIFFPSF